MTTMGELAGVQPQRQRLDTRHRLADSAVRSVALRAIDILPLATTAAFGFCVRQVLPCRSGRNRLFEDTALFEHTVRPDLHHIDTWSMRQHPVVLTRTPCAVVGSAGAH